MPRSRPRPPIPAPTSGGAAPAIRTCRPPRRASPTSTHRRGSPSSTTGRCGNGSRRRAAPSASISGALGYGFNTKEIAGKKLAEPKCWADLLDPKLKDEIQVADPNSSGTAYTLLATIIQLMGEEKGFDYLKKLHRNVNQYTKSGAAPAKATALGETAVGITFMHEHGDDGGRRRPGEGRRALRGHRLRDRLDVDRQGRPQPRQRQEMVRLGAEPGRAGDRRDAKKQYQIPSNKTAPISPHSPKLGEIKLIDFDFAKYGSSEERRRLLSKWDAEIKGAPK